MVVHSIDAETSARAIVENIVCRYGAFRDIHSDQGRNWESRVFAEVLNLLQIRRTRNTPMYPKGNGRVERFIRTLIQHLAVVVREDQRDWPSWIPLILLAYRTAPHTRTRITPAEMLYGRMLSLPADLAREPPPGPHLYLHERDYPMWLRVIMRRIHQDARVAREQVAHKYKVTYDLHTALFAGKPGDMVWLYRPQRVTGRNPKLATKWEGPYLILDRVSDLLLRIQNVDTGRERVVNVQNVARYTDPECPVRGAWLQVVPDGWPTLPLQDEAS